MVLLPGKYLDLVSVRIGDDKEACRDRVAALQRLQLARLRALRLEPFAQYSDGGISSVFDGGAKSGNKHLLRHSMRSCLAWRIGLPGFGLRITHKLNDDAIRFA